MINKKEYIWICKICGQTFKTRRQLQAHYKENPSHRRYITKPHYNLQCRFCGLSKKTTREGMTLHEKHCMCNPNRVPGNWYKKQHSTAVKKLISEKMKIAHAEKRAGTFPSRKNREHSYPEKWLIKVLKNELNMSENIDYETEKYFCGQFLDFAWNNQKKCIEIDGQQHDRFQKRKDNDKRKDNNLKMHGWKLLRIKWKDVCNNTQFWINEIINFLKD